MRSSAALVALVGVLAAATGCAEREREREAVSPVAASAAGGSAAEAPAVAAVPAPMAVPRAVVDAVNPARLRLGPGNPGRGVAYPFDLYSHCGIDFARFGGRTWRAQTPLPEPRTLPDAKGITTYTSYTAGTMTLLDDEIARFVIDERRYEVPGSPVVLFHPTTATPPLCQ